MAASPVGIGNLLRQGLRRLLGRRDNAPPLEQLQPLMDRLQGEYERRAVALAEGLAQGRISIDDWQLAMQTEIRRYHMGASVLGSGGAHRADALTYQTAQAKAAEQIRYLNAWADEMRDGRFPVDAAARIRQRAKLYGGAGTATFNESRTRSLGLPPLPQVPGDGRTACRTNCKCRIEYVEVDGGFDVFWRLGAAEHCPDCERLAAEWNPLRVRNGEVEQG